MRWEESLPFDPGYGLRLFTWYCCRGEQDKGGEDDKNEMKNIRLYKTASPQGRLGDWWVPVYIYVSYITYLVYNTPGIYTMVYRILVHFLFIAARSSFNQPKC